MKILYSIDCRPRGGGAPISSGILIESLIETNPELEIGLIMPDYEGENYDFEGSIDVFRIPGYSSFPYMFQNPLQWLRLVWKVKEIIATFKPNIIHCQMPKVAMAVSLLKKAKLIDEDIILVYTDREHLATLKKKHLPIYRFFIAKEYDSVISLSRVNENFWRKNTPIIKVDVIANPAGKNYEILERVADDQNGIGAKK